jgi:peptidoglycan/LPS O-acetylase OafA/YrhL
VLRAVPSFIFGAALFYNRNIISRLPAPGFSLAVATSGLITAMVFGVPQLVTLLIVYAVAIAAVAADLQGAPSAAVRRLAPLGQLTYSIYMWHLIFILLLTNAVGDKFFGENALSMAVLGVACYVAIFSMSYLSFFFIETPARRWIDRIKLSKPAFAGFTPPA